jgi:excisionase family DNA binding protein
VKENIITFLTRKELCERWAVSTMTIKRRESAGTLPVYKLGRGTRYKLADIEKIEAQAEVKR